MLIIIYSIKDREKFKYKFFSIFFYFKKKIEKNLYLNFEYNKKDLHPFHRPSGVIFLFLY